jgi:hypothetical protein
VRPAGPSGLLWPSCRPFDLLELDGVTIGRCRSVSVMIVWRGCSPACQWIALNEHTNAEGAAVFRPMGEMMTARRRPPHPGPPPTPKKRAFFHSLVRHAYD